MLAATAAVAALAVVQALAAGSKPLSSAAAVLAAVGADMRVASAGQGVERTAGPGVEGDRIAVDVVGEEVAALAVVGGTSLDSAGLAVPVGRVRQLVWVVGATVRGYPRSRSLQSDLEVERRWRGLRFARCVRVRIERSSASIVVVSRVFGQVAQVDKVCAGVAEAAVVVDSVAGRVVRLVDNSSLQAAEDRRTSSFFACRRTDRGLAIAVMRSFVAEKGRSLSVARCRSSSSPYHLKARDPGRKGCWGTCSTAGERRTDSKSMRSPCGPRACGRSI